MSTVEEKSKPEAEPTSVRTEEVKKRRRKGKGSQKKSTEAYQRTQECEEYDLFNRDQEGKLYQTVKLLFNAPIKSAVPVSITTRGVGFAVSAIYEQSGTTWTQTQMWEIATVYQIYRVSLYLMEYTVFLAQQVQIEPIYDTRPFEIIKMDGAIANELATIQRVPSSVALILKTVGKLIRGNSIYHVGFAVEDQFDSPLEFRTMVIRPSNIRSLLEDASSIANRELAVELKAYNSIPGLRFHGGVVADADAVWPESYGLNDLKADINAFKAWVNRAEKRMPKCCFPRISLNGMGGPGILMSCYRAKAKLEANFSVISRKAPPVPASPVRKKRQAAAPQVVHQYVFTSEVSTSEKVEFWSYETVDHKSRVLGASILVGEYCGMPTRHQLNSTQHVVIDPVSVLNSIASVYR